MEIKSNAITLDEIVEEIKQTSEYSSGMRKFILITDKYDEITKDIQNIFNFPLPYKDAFNKTGKIETAMQYNNKLYKDYTNLLVYGLDLTILKIENT